MANPEQGTPTPGEAEGKGQEAETRHAVGLLARWLQTIIEMKKSGSISGEEIATRTLLHNRYDKEIAVNGNLEIIHRDEKDRHAMADISFRKEKPVIAMVIGGNPKEIPVFQIKLNIQINEQTEIMSFLLTIILGDINSSKIDFAVGKRSSGGDDWQIGEGILNKKAAKFTLEGTKQLGGWIAWLAGEHLPAFFDVTETDPSKLGAALIEEMRDK